MAPHLPFAGVCYNAIDVEEVPFRASSEGHPAFLGRMAPETGAAEAIALARDAGLPLLIAAMCREPAEQAYLERAVVPHLGPDVVFVGERSAGASRSAWCSSRRWPAARRCWPPTGARSRRSCATG